MIYLEDGEFAELSCETIKIFDCTGQEIRKKVTRILWDVQAAEKGGYEHFMLKEIMEQPGAVKATIAPRIKEGKVVFEELGLTASEIGEIHYRLRFGLLCGLRREICHRKAVPHSGGSGAGQRIALQ